MSAADVKKVAAAVDVSNMRVNGRISDAETSSKQRPADGQLLCRYVMQF